MNVTQTPSTDDSHVVRAEETRVDVDGMTMLLFYFSIEELAELTPGELHLLAALSVEADEQTQDTHIVGTAKEYQDRIRERVTRHVFLSDSTLQTHSHHHT